MKRPLSTLNLSTLFSFALCVGSLASLQGNEPLEGLAISSGGLTGTYIKIGEDLSRLGVSKKLGKLTNSVSSGSLENLERLSDLMNHDSTVFAIVQGDTINYLKLPRNAKLSKKVDSHVRLLLPLFYEHIHVLVAKNRQDKQDFNHLSDLFRKNLKIWAGGRGSGSRITAEVLEHAIRRNQTDPLWTLVDADIASLGRALNELDTGDIDAILTVGAAPISTLKHLPDSANIKLLAVGNLTEHYRVKEVSYDTETLEKGAVNGYGWLDKPVETFKVPAILVCRSFAELDVLQRQAMPRAVDMIISNLAELTTNGTAARQWKEATRVMARPQNWEGWTFYGNEEPDKETINTLKRGKIRIQTDGD